mgnify:CR=1 FL=1
MPKPKGVPKGGSKFAAYFTTKTGRKVYAKDYGYKAWPIGG